LPQRTTTDLTSCPPVCEFVVESFFRGKRIDTFLGKHLRNYSSYRLQRMIQAGCVQVNDVSADVSHRVRPREVVRIRLVSPPDRVAVAEPLPLEVVYEDPWLIAVNKPPGQIAHPGGDFAGKTLLNAIQFHIDQQTPLPGLIRPGIVHRIDRQTSGVMVVPKDHLAHRRLTQQFERREVSKSYMAILRGQLPDDSGSIDLPIGVVPNPTCTLSCAKPIAVGARPARTVYRVLERFPEHTLVEASPLTGRHHQIRIHFAEIGYPLLADEFYDRYGAIKDGTPLELPDDQVPEVTGSDGSPDAELIEPEIVPDDDRSSEVSERDRDTPTAAGELFYDPSLPLRRHALHAGSLLITHPITGMPLQLDAPLPADMEETLAALRAGSAVGVDS